VVPTSGAAPTRDNVHAWIDAGCVCLGMGSKLFDVARLESGADPELARRVADTLRWIQEARA
jgi:2-dehydro-3-deoxyphosphogluconate aldolase/(4S)-4-hydroxy-2-oxoglutarate aldolase